MAYGEVIRLHPQSEEEFRTRLREIGFSDGKIDETVRLVLEEVVDFDALDVITVFRTSDGLVILPEEKLEVWRPKRADSSFP